MIKYPLFKSFCCKQFLIWMVMIWFLSSMVGCGLFKSKEAKELEKTPESLIAEGLDAYQRKQYEKAGEAFQNLKDRFPYNPYAIVAELKLADSHFLNKEYLLAATAYKEFEKLHPANEIIPYVIFQLAMCYFKQMPTIDRDQSNAFLAVQEFERLIKNYPQSEYVSQAEVNLIKAKKNLAAHEFYIGEFYFNQKKYEAALGRFEGILRDFPDSAYPPKLKNYIAICKEKLAQPQAEKAPKS
jgi:outer membrane protein assembly factor BamD